MNIQDALLGGQKEIEPAWYGPFGETTPDQYPLNNRQAIAQSAIGQNVLDSGVETADALTKAAYSPTIGQSTDLLRRTINGDFLNGGPQLANLLQSVQGRAQRGAADSNAKIRSQYARTGQGFGTGQQQAQQASSAAATASAADTAANVANQVYQTERDRQYQAIPQALTVEEQPARLLGQKADAYQTPANNAAQVLKNLYGGGQVRSRDFQETPGAMDYIAKILSLVQAYQGTTGA